MSLSHYIQLLVLSAIWGASFLFMKVAVPSFGPVVLIALRVLLAAIFLLAVIFIQKKSLEFNGHYPQLLLLGLLSSAAPFLLLAYAAQTLDASLMSVLNATAPIWGVLTVSVWLKESVSPKKLLGLGLGVVGVYILVGMNKAFSLTMLPAVIAALLSTVFYGIASAYTQSLKGLSALAKAHGSLWGAVLFTAPLIIAYPIKTTPSFNVICCVIALGVICSGVAFLMYFRLIEQVGATSALTVTYLIPIFGILWGNIFLNEEVGLSTLIGTAIILCSTALVTGFKFSAIYRAFSKI